MGIAECGYCGAAMASQNLMGRKRMPDGKPWPGHRRFTCVKHSSGNSCPVPGSVQSTPIENALIFYCADAMRMRDLMNGGDQGQAQRAELAAARRRLAAAEAQLARLAEALASDEGAIPITLLRKIRTLEDSATAERESIARIERELANHRPVATPDMAEKWLSLLDGVAALDVEARMEARELIRANFSRIRIWHRGDPAGDEDVIDIELTARGGGSTRLRIDRKTGLAIE